MGVDLPVDPRGGEERETIIVMIMVRKKAAAAAVRLEDWYAHWTCQN